MQQGSDTKNLVSYETKSVTVNPAMKLVNYASLVTINLLSILRNSLTSLCNFLTSNFFTTKLNISSNELTSLLSNMVNINTTNTTNEIIHNITDVNNESKNFYYYLLINSFINISSNMDAKKKNNLKLLVVINNLLENINDKLYLSFYNLKNYLSNSNFKDYDSYNKSNYKYNLYYILNNRNYLISEKIHDFSRVLFIKHKNILKPK